MRKETKAMGIVLALALVLALVLSITSTGVAQASANPVRDMPESVRPGEDFNVTVTWTAPADAFNAIGLTDYANATASMTVSGNPGWCTPTPNANTTANNKVEYAWYGPYSSGTSFTAIYNVQVPTDAPERNYKFNGNLLYYIGGNGPYTEDIAGDSVITIEKTKAIFDTGSPENPYPSIFGIHNGTIKPNVTIKVCRLYTYPCEGTGGHVEYARIWNSSLDTNATWNGYIGDWHNISFNKTFTLVANKIYNYTICTGSYPQIIHAKSKPVTGGTITCTRFTDVNGNTYNNWIPAIRLE
jgi:hypothetical protein